MRLGTCRLCQQHRELCDSHALPNSLFNYILRKSDGKAIAVTDDPTTPTQYTADTWDTELLCQDCEESLNNRYDRYGMAVFRGHIGTVSRGSAGVTITGVDRRRLRMFFLSVLWRISISSHPSYSNIDLPYAWEEELHDALRTDRHVPSARFTVTVYKLRDSTRTGGFDAEALRSFIMAPFGRSFGSLISVCFLFLGFFVEVFLPRVPKAYSKRTGVLHGTSRVFFAPYAEVLEIPEIMQLLVRGLHKEHVGLSRVG